MIFNGIIFVIIQFLCRLYIIILLNECENVEKQMEIESKNAR